MLDAARRMLAGERLYADLIDLNPPFVFWLSQPAVLIARLGFDPADVLRVMVLLILGGMLALAWPLTREAPAVRAGFVLFAFAIPLGHFAEREHLIFGLMVGYVVLASERHREEGAKRPTRRDPMASSAAPPPPRSDIMAGIAAGIAMAIKPPAALVPIVLTVYACIRERSARPILRAENLAAFATLAVAFASILVFAPAYLDAVSAYGALYAEFSRGTLRQLLLRDIYPLSVWLALIVAAVTVRSVANRQRVTVLALAAAGFLAAAAVQGKGFGYHYFPAMGFAVITMLELLLAPVMAERHTTGVARRVIAATGLLIVLLLPFLVAAERFMGKVGSDVVERSQLSGALRDLPPGSRVAIFSVRLADAYPILLERKWEHVLSMPHLWFTGLGGRDSGLGTRGSGLETRGSGLEARDSGASAALWRRVGENLRDGRPRAIVVRAPAPGERTRGDLAVNYLDFVCADPVARAALSGYGLSAHAGGYDIYRPQSSGAGACASS
ncbi:MAG TPA: hypothetical protein VFT04_08640 [Gemmatimonadales bacterium]|nr:hypothetical protein [Gemmatimonadales bacterium]